MKCACDREIEKALAITRDLLALAEEGEGQSEDAGCAVLFGIIRDCAYRIRTEAERECALHAAKEIAQRKERRI